jgi:glycosyltransferase A (GT-A) superfamily protein (DUF2064 family)
MATRPVTLAVIVKSPQPGQVKTRLCPPCDHDQAAAIARALFDDVVAAARQVGGVELAVLDDGERGSWLPADLRTVRQRGRGLDERLELAFFDLPAPAVIVAADSEIGADDLDRVVAPLANHTADAVIGPAVDGGYWALGLSQPMAGATRGVPMQVAHTLAAQLSRLRLLGLRVALAPTRRDVDTFDDVITAIASRPHSALARCVSGLDLAAEVARRQGRAA